MKPKQFRQLLEQYESALVFKFDVPMEILFSEGRREVARVVHETSADLERLALAGGCISALGLAGGSCKPIFCGQEPNCVVISQGKECLHPDSARMSMSGLGINFNQICKKLGWQEFDPDKAKGRKSPSEGLMAGMVLVGWEESGKN
jgi:predicted metal-binding protein